MDASVWICDIFLCYPGPFCVLKEKSFIPHAINTLKQSCYIRRGHNKITSVYFLI